MKLSSEQQGVLDAINKHGFWYYGCQWLWLTHNRTERVLIKLRELGYVKSERKVIQDEEVTVFTPN